MSSRKKLILNTLLILLVGCLLLTIGGIWFYRANALGHAQSKSGIKVPTREILPTTYFGDFYQLTEVQLLESRRETFVDDYPFRQVSLRESQVWPYEVDLREQYWQAFPNRHLIESSNELYFYGDCTEDGNWTYLFEKQSGYLWIIVEFPDMSGDNPSCPIGH